MPLVDYLQTVYFKIVVAEIASALPSNDAVGPA